MSTPSASPIQAHNAPPFAVYPLRSNHARSSDSSVQSGAGKSTIQNVLIRLLDGYEGHIRVFDRDLRAWDRNYYRRIGVAFEAPNHYLKLSALENLRLFAGLHGGHTESPETLLRRVGLPQDGNKLVAEFSKGMRGRLTLARALLHRPELLFWTSPPQASIR